MRAEIVLYQLDLFGAGKMHIGQLLEHLRVIDGGVVVSDLDAAPTLQRRKHHENIGHAVALVFVIVTRGLSAKNAILIIEFAKDLQAQGKGLIEATLEAAHLRLRPILMTSLAFILGVRSEEHT